MRGQSLVELAVSIPVVIVLALGSAALVRLADARSGLDGAAAAAVASAVRQASATEAATCAQSRFAAVVKDYPLIAPVLVTSDGGFARGARYQAVATATVDLSFVPLAFLPGRVALTAAAAGTVEPWRSRQGQPCA